MKPINKSAIVTGAAKRIGEVLHEIKSSGGDGQLINMDLSYPDCGEQIINQIDKAAPPVELLINNAARFEYDSLSTINNVSLDQHFFANVRGPILLSKAFFELVKKGQQGCVINILDNKIFALNPDYLSYTAPGITLESGGQGESSFQKGQKMSPMGKVSSVEDIIKALFFIVNTTSLNGHIITIDGGQRLQKLDRDVAFL